MLDALAESDKTLTERREAHARPEEKVEARAVAQAVAVADELSARGVVQSIGELKSSIGRMLGELSDKLEEQVSRYVQIQRAIAGKEQELKDIYEIQRSASTLTALIETHERQRIELESDLAATREQVQREIEQARGEWEDEKKAHEHETRERESIEQKRREREKEEYRYTFAREQQQARDQFADETTRAQKELAERKAQADRELDERERAIRTREEDLTTLRQRVEAFPKELDAAVARAAKDTTSRLQQDAASREELLKREFAGERNVLNTRIAALEQTAKEQAEQIGKLIHLSEKANAQVQEIAVRAIEGSAGAKQLASLQQMLAEQSRKGLRNGKSQPVPCYRCVVLVVRNGKPNRVRDRFDGLMTLSRYAGREEGEGLGPSVHVITVHCGSRGS
jgi:hypothetical protein